MYILHKIDKLIKINIIMNDAIMGEGVSMNPRYENEQYLLGIIREKLNISDEDMQSVSTVRAKVRDSKLNEVLEFKNSESINS